MKNQKSIVILVVLIIIISAISASFGIFSNEGPGNYMHRSIRGEEVEIHGRGIYAHMSADVAVQGIAQDYVTLFVGIPLLIISLIGTGRGSLKSRFLLAGTLMYFLVTFLFYTTMGMYNIMFLAYVSLLALSFFAFMAVLLGFKLDELSVKFKSFRPLKFGALFLIISSVSIALMWLGVIIPPLLDGSIYPESLQHYTTLIVQGLDLGLLLPICFVSALLLLRRNPLGYLATPVYLVFLSILMTALSAKIIGMAMVGANVIPAVFIIPVFNLLAIFSASITLSAMKKAQA